MAYQDIIDSGTLELYIAGVLSDEENERIYKLLQKHPEVLDEIQQIEKSIGALTANVAPNQNNQFKEVLIKLLQEKESTDNVISINKNKSNWKTYSGWAAAIVVGSTLLLSINKNNNLQGQLNSINEAQKQYEQQLEKTTNDLAKNKTLLASITNKNVITVPLQGQQVAPNAYAKAFWNKKTNNVYLDVSGLPTPPEGKVYQVWSLTLNPLTPTSLGTLDKFADSDTKIFTIENLNNSEAFGITLEPVGGSKTPTLEQLYTLGTIS